MDGRTDGRTDGRHNDGGAPHSAGSATHKREPGFPTVLHQHRLPGSEPPGPGWSLPTRQGMAPRDGAPSSAPSRPPRCPPLPAGSTQATLEVSLRPGRPCPFWLFPWPVPSPFPGTSLPPSSGTSLLLGRVQRGPQPPIKGFPPGLLPPKCPRRTKSWGTAACGCLRPSINVEGKGNVGSWVSLAPFQGLESHEWLAAMVLTAGTKTSSPPCRKCCRMGLVSRVLLQDGRKRVPPWGRRAPPGPGLVHQ